MNPVIDTLLQHRTYRAFDPDHRIPAAEVDAMLAAARQASSWMNGQHYTIIRITDAALRQKIVAAQPANPQIGSCAEYWLFIGDAHKAELCSRAYAGSMAGVGVPDTLLTLATDAALADYEATMTAFGEAREKLPYREKFARYYSREYGVGNPALLKHQGLLTHPDGLDDPAAQ